MTINWLAHPLTALEHHLVKDQVCGAFSLLHNMTSWPLITFYQKDRNIFKIKIVTNSKSTIWEGSACWMPRGLSVPLQICWSCSLAGPFHAQRSRHTRHPFPNMPVMRQLRPFVEPCVPCVPRIPSPPLQVCLRSTDILGHYGCAVLLGSNCVLKKLWTCVWFWFLGISSTWKLSEDSLPTMRCAGSKIRNVNYLLCATPTLETYVHLKYCDYISAPNGIQEALIPNPAAEV